MGGEEGVNGGMGGGKGLMDEWEGGRGCCCYGYLFRENNEDV